MPRPWTGRRSLSRGKSLPSADHTYPRRLIIASGLVLGSSYLATSIPTSFALDRPLHTIAAVLLLSGLAIVAYETRAAKTRRPHNHHNRHVAIPLQDANGRPSYEEHWSSEERPFHHRGLNPRALAVMLAALLCLMGVRIAVFHAVINDVECAGPQLTVSTRSSHVHCNLAKVTRHSCRLSSRFSTLIARQRTARCLLGALSHHLRPISTASYTSFSTDLLATSFLRYCSPSAASSLRSEPACCARHTYVPCPPPPHHLSPNCRYLDLS